MKKQYHSGLLVGRFQPFHKGHLYLVEESLKVTESLIIAVGSVNVHNEDNPLSFHTRKKIIQKVFEHEGLSDRLVTIISVPDYRNDQKWFNDILSKSGKIDVVVGNNEWTNRIFRERNYQVLEFPYYKRELYEGIKIRTLITNKKKWDSRVPSYIIADIKKGCKEFCV